MKEILNKVIKNQQRFVQQLINVKNFDYTAFQVFPTSTTIVNGRTINNIYYYNEPSKQSYLNGQVCFGGIVACNTHVMKIASYTDKNNIDVIVDWGDGIIEKCKDIQPVISKAQTDQIPYTTIYSYQLSHTYSETEKIYTVKIYGKDYWRITPGDLTKNIICRCFQSDLPIASHIKNLASFCRSSSRIFRVQAPTYIFNRHIFNMALTFAGCWNLRYAVGFSISTNKIYNCNSTFSSCSKLKYTDFRLPDSILSSSEDKPFTETFFQCKELQVDILDLLPVNGFVGGQSIDLYRTFGRLYKATCSDYEKLGNILWNNKLNIFSSIKETFASNAQTTLDLSKIPISWGGTNNNIDIALKITEQMKNDYTSFQVYAHDTRINAGELSTQQHIKFIGKQGDVIAFAVNPSMTESFILCSQIQQSKQDVIIDWGDGNYTDVSTIEPEILSDGAEYRYLVSHTYNITGTYIVKIYGKSYFSFTSSGSEATSLISRVFEHDLPIAKHVWNLSSAFQHSNRLLHINMWSHSASYQIIHWSGGFTSARNLIECVGFSKYSHRESNYNMFQNCINLVSTDLRIAEAPADMSTGDAYTFTNCPKLQADVSSLLPVQGFKNGSTINVARFFKKCVSLKGTVPANILWNNKNINWLNTNQAFSDCSDEIRSQVPVSWGGLASDDIIQKNQYITNIEFTELESKITELSGKLQ